MITLYISNAISEKATTADRHQQSSKRSQGVGTLIIVCYMLAQFVCKPFWDKRVNLLDCVCARWSTL